MSKCKTTLERTAYTYVGNDEELDSIVDTIIRQPLIINLIKESSHE